MLTAKDNTTTYHLKKCVHFINILSQFVDLLNQVWRILKLFSTILQRVRICRSIYNN